MENDSGKAMFLYAELKNLLVVAVLGICGPVPNRVLSFTEQKVHYDAKTPHIHFLKMLEI